MFGWFSEARVWASRVNRARRSGSFAKESGRTLSATSRFELRVARAIDLSHAPFADRRGDFVDAETGAGGERQICRDYTRRTAVLTEIVLMPRSARRAL